MSALANSQHESWEPFGVTDTDFEATTQLDGVRVVNLTLGGKGEKKIGAGWLRAAAIALSVLAAAAAGVSWQAQYVMVWQVKRATWVAALEAGIPDVGAVVFAALGIALALHGRRAARPRALNVACVGISLAMNALAAGHGWRDLAIWVMPSALYALASDTLIGVVRAWVLARARNLGETLAEDTASPLSLAAGAALWLLRLSLAPRSTLTGFRDWVVTDCPVAPGLRPGHIAALEAVRREASQQAALATVELKDTVSRASAEARQAHEEAAHARAAEAMIRSELDRTQTDTAQLVTRALDEAANERRELQQRTDSLTAELEQVRGDAARLTEAVRETTDNRTAALEDARVGLLDASEQLTKALQVANEAQKPSQPRRPASGEPTKREQMIELAGQRQDLATIPLSEVSKLASEVAAEIGYSAGTARRELVRHVRQIQATEEIENTDEGAAQ